jgi:cytochrome b561
MTDIQRYDSRTIRLHWLSALCIATLWVLGQSIDFFPREQRFLVISTHIVIGLALLVIIALRLSWRLGPKSTKLPKAEPGALGAAAVGVHHLLYLLVLAVLAIGLVLEATRGDSLYHLLPLPHLLNVTREVRHTINEFHEWGANSLLALAALHGAAAIWHHVIKKDGVLLRMR